MDYVCDQDICTFGFEWHSEYPRIGGGGKVRAIMAATDIATQAIVVLSSSLKRRGVIR